ncbi:MULTISPECIES: type II toxin-antitoxin system HicB family antitoxin [unclassified Paenibacillus]|uniref:type II toxin-antitoxin system HicB family antitoxin n=1 Tax=unclassified Paenibacillus TaxID=185978 RepID=UPI00277E7615|nr:MULTISPECIES: type II toxin-antitoxin system HicB family antitoxin [unclassified Paenibacillus]MDQ0896279.1 putative RNase H-like HicB family nuclease [Paenibacillus sp. V4I7]MDQ0913793.1 putative RNase H-like HicB family nuclease [Paenibacillus sp. V4I5]
MEQLLQHSGNQKELLEIAEKHARLIQGVVIGEVGREASVNFISYGVGGVYIHFTFHALFTGAETQFYISIADKESDKGVLTGYKGDWSCPMAMMDASHTVNTLFPVLPYKQKRGILRELGKLMYKVLSEFDSKATLNLDSESIRAVLTIDRYEVLTDIEWIEEMMDANSSNLEYRVLIEKNTGDSEYSAYIPAIRKTVEGNELGDVLLGAKNLITNCVQDALRGNLTLPEDKSFIDTVIINADVLRKH